LKTVSSFYLECYKASDTKVSKEVNATIFAAAAMTVGKYQLDLNKKALRHFYSAFYFQMFMK
jgi:hypothetical protein